MTDRQAGESVPARSVTASDVKAALHRRYCKADLSGEQYVCIEEARSGAGFAGNDGSCDFLAINTYHGRGMELIGHEVKVSMTDWKAELAQPEKAERFARYCRRWYVAVPAALASKIKHEVPPAWGLLSLSDKGRWTETIKAPPRSPETVPEWWWIGWLAQFDRQAKRAVGAQVRAAVEIEQTNVNEQIKEAVGRRTEAVIERHKRLTENAEALREATGIDLFHVWRGNFDRLAQMYDLARARGSEVDAVVREMRSAADALEGLTQRADDPAAVAS